MKLFTAALIATTWFGLATARADDDEPLTDTAATKAGERWMTAMLAPGGAVAAPSKEQPLDYVTSNKTKSCKALKAGAAKDFKAAAKLKTCVVDSYKRATKDKIPGQWFELRAADLDGAVARFPAKNGKALRAQAKDSTIVTGHDSGDGLNFDVYLSLDAKNHVHALWLTEEAFE